MGVFEFYHHSIEKFKDVGVLQRSMNSHLLIDRFTLFICRAFGQRNDLACRNAMLSDIDRAEDTGP